MYTVVVTWLDLSEETFTVEDISYTEGCLQFRIDRFTYRFIPLTSLRQWIRKQ